MPQLGPIKRRSLIRYLRVLGFTGPFTAADHDFMTRQGVELRIPNDHGSDISVGLLKRILREGHITNEEWNGLA